MDTPIGKKLKAAREAADMGQHELSRLSGVSQGMISQIESGDRPKPGIEIIRKLENALKLKPWELAGAVSTEVERGYTTEEFLALSSSKKEISRDEAEMLRGIKWYDPARPPSLADWNSFVELQRSMRAR